MTEPLEASESKSEISDAVLFRLLGLVILGVGIILVLCFLGWPIYQAHNGAARVTILKKFVALAIFTVVSGINGIIFGKSAFTWFPSMDTNLSKISLATWGLLIGNGGIVVYLSIEFERYLSKLGYNFMYQ